MWRVIAVSAWRKGSLSPHANMRSSWSCRSFVKFGPTADANIPTHWNIGSSEGAFFLLVSCEIRISGVDALTLTLAFADRA